VLRDTRVSADNDSFASALEPTLSNRPSFPDQPLWGHPPMPSEYPILPPSPVSGVSSPWLSSTYSHPTLAVVDSIESYQNPYSSINISGITSLSPPESATPPKWDLMLEHERHSAVQSSSSSPAPVLAAPPILLPVSGTGSDELLQDGQLGGILHPTRQKTYTDAYWKHFHPVFPIVHQRLRFMPASNPSASSAGRARRLLQVTMMAVGAQYSEEWFAPSDSRILHEKCQEVIVKNQYSISATFKVEIMQAVVLAEFLAQFKAKRAPEGLSEIFRAVYDNVSAKYPFEMY
jgi:hypothetical protein